MMGKDKRIQELEELLRRRDERITELLQERDRERETVAKLRDFFDDRNGLIDQWIEAFNMVPNENGDWSLSEYHRDCDEIVEKYLKLQRDWNRFVKEYNAIVAPTKRNFGRPLAASPVQKKDVLKRRGAGQSLQFIADETGLGFQTVRTIIDKQSGVDRATMTQLKKIETNKITEAHQRAGRKLRDALPGRINKTLKQAAELRKELKGQD